MTLKEVIKEFKLDKNNINLDCTTTSDMPYLGYNTIRLIESGERFNHKFLNCRVVTMYGFDDGLTIVLDVRDVKKFIIFRFEKDSEEEK